MENIAQVSRRRRRSPVVAALLAAAAVTASAATGAGKPTDNDKEEAEKLFLEGREALGRGEKDLACVKFRSSQALSPSANTLANVAQCEDYEGKLLDALVTWQRVLPEFPEGDDRQKVAKERIASLESRIPQLELIVPADLPAGAKILIDGAAVERAALGAPSKLTVGEHTVVVEAEGRKEQRFRVTLAVGDRKDLQVSAGPLAAPPPPPPSASAVQNTPVNGRRIGAFVSGGVGVAALVAAGITGGMIIAQDGRIQAECRVDESSGKHLCSRAGIDAIAADQPVLIANGVVWGVGIAGVGLGAVLFLTGGKSSAARAALAPLVVPGGGGAAFTGRF